MPDKPMRDDELSRRLFSDDCGEAPAGLARLALARLEDEEPAWLPEIIADPPEAPAALVEAALTDGIIPRPTRLSRGLWLWGSGALAAAALAGLLVIRSEPPPVAVVQTAPPPAVSPPAAPAPASPKGLVNAVEMGVMPPQPVLAMVKTIPRVRETLVAYVATPDDTARKALVLALEEGGLRLDSQPDISTIQVDPALTARLKGKLPARLRVRLDGKGGLSISE